MTASGYRQPHRAVTKAEPPAILRHLRRVIFAGLGSEILPAFLRLRLLRRLGGKVDASACIWSGCNIRSARITLGRNVFINVGFFFDGTQHLTVGDNVRMGQHVSIITATHEIGPSHQRCTVEPVYGDVTIEEGCWIGTGVTILPGVIIRRGCVIGAGTIVKASTEPNGLYAGVPARRIRDLES